jgi:hypothetical protein
MSNNKPTEVECRYVAEIWKQMLREPKYDNGDGSLSGLATKALAASIRKHVTEETLGVFGGHLVDSLMEMFKTRDYVYLEVDYNPCLTLHEAAKYAGMVVEFPWKTLVTVERGHVSVKYGYRAEPVHHYLLDDGRWFVAALAGSDVEKIKRFIVDGTPLEFMVVDGEQTRDPNTPTEYDINKLPTLDDVLKKSEEG